MDWKAYWKAIIAALAPVYYAFQSALDGDGIITREEWINIIILSLIALGVFGKANTDRFGKNLQDKSTGGTSSGTGAVV